MRPADDDDRPTNCPHGYSPIPIPILRLLLLIIVKSTRTQRRTETDLVFGQSLDDDGGYAQVGTVVSLGVFDVFVREGRHGLDGFFHGYVVLLLLLLFEYIIIIIIISLDNVSSMLVIVLIFGCEHR